MSESDTVPTPNAWLADPPFVLFRFLANETAVAGLARNAVILSEMSPWLFKAATKSVPQNNKRAMAALGRLITQSKSHSAFASEEMKRGFRTLSAHSAIAIWAGIETAIEQTLLNHIRKLPEAKQLMAASAPALKLEKLQTASEADARKALRKWEAALEEPGALDRALRMLAAVDLDLEISEEARRLLSEMAEVRNVLLHRGGVVDEWLVTKCTWLDLKVGDELIVDEAKLDKFIDAAHAFAKAFAQAVTKSTYLFVAAI